MLKKRFLYRAAMFFVLGCSAVFSAGEALADMSISRQSQTAGFSDLAMDQEGNGVMIKAREDGISLKLIAQRYRSDGTPAGEAVTLKTDAPKQWKDPRLAMATDTGDYVIVWSGGYKDGSVYPPATYTALYGQRYNKEDIPQGNPFQITVSEDPVTEARVVMDAKGNVLIVWSCGLEYGLSRILARKFDSNSAALSGETLIAQDLTRDDTYLFLADVGMDPEGGWVVAYMNRTNTPWVGSSSMYTTRYEYSVYFQRYNADITPLDRAEKRISIPWSNALQTPNLTMDHQGGFVVTWRPGIDENLFAFERFDRYGRPTGLESKVAYDRGHYSLPYHNAICPSIAGDGNGNFIATWISADAVYAQGFSADLTPLGEATVLTENAGQYSGFSKVAMNSNGQFMILFNDIRINPEPSYYLVQGELSVSGPGSSIPDKSYTSSTIGFNARFYLNDRPDLKAAGYTEENVKNHWEQYGIAEGRRGSRYFDVRYYLENYRDIRNAFGSDYYAAYIHFLTFGVREGRQGSDEFDVSSYVERYPDLIAAFGSDYHSAYLHWIMFGVSEGRQGVPGDGRGHATQWNE